MIDYAEARMYLEAFSSCAIEGNKFSQAMCQLWRTDRGKYINALESFIERTKDD